MNNKEDNTKNSSLNLQRNSNTISSKQESKLESKENNNGSSSKSIANKLIVSKNISDLDEEFNHESPSNLLTENKMLKKINQQLEYKLKIYENNI